MAALPRRTAVRTSVCRRV